MQNYTDLKIYHKAHKLTLDIYKETNEFPKEEIFTLTNQMRRAAISVTSNIVEGRGRLGDKEFSHFLNISLGSLFELEYQVTLASDLGYIQQQTHKSLLEESTELRKMIFGLISRIKS